MLPAWQNDPWSFATFSRPLFVQETLIWRLAAALNSSSSRYSTVSPLDTTPSSLVLSPTRNPFFAFTNDWAAVPCPVPSAILVTRAVAYAFAGLAATARWGRTFAWVPRPHSNVPATASIARVLLRIVFMAVAASSPFRFVWLVCFIGFPSVCSSVFFFPPVPRPGRIRVFVPAWGVELAWSVCAVPRLLPPRAGAVRAG